MMGVKVFGERKPNEAAEEGCPDSWEMADLETSMMRLMPAAAEGAAAQDSAAGDKEAEPNSAASALPVDEFLREALQNPHDRMTILRLEHEVEKFVKNPYQQQFEFPAMPSSYMRLAAHRVAQHYYLQTSVIDSSFAEGCRIIVRKNGDIRLPAMKLADVPVTQQEAQQSSTTKFVIKQRPQDRLRSRASGIGSSSGSGNNPAKSVEERNEEYNRARARIFQDKEQRAYDELLEMEKKESAKEQVGRRSSSSSSGGGSGTKSATRDLGDKGSSSVKSRQKVAIFRDREKDKKDPDYDRNYDRYSQRFDPGFGLGNQPTFGMQARYTPVVNYNTEFPRLGGPPAPPGQAPMAGPHVQAGGGWNPAFRAPFNQAMNPHTGVATYMSQYAYPQAPVGYTNYSSQISQQPESQARRR